MFKKFVLISLLLSTLLTFLVPSEGEYLERITYDYGKLHAGGQLDALQLQKMLSYQFEHHLFYSKFSGRFGNLGVEYYGFLNMIFFTGSTRPQQFPEAAKA